MGYKNNSLTSTSNDDEDDDDDEDDEDDENNDDDDDSDDDNDKSGLRWWRILNLTVNVNYSSVIITFDCMNLQDQFCWGPWPLWQEEKNTYLQFKKKINKQITYWIKFTKSKLIY